MDTVSAEIKALLNQVGDQRAKDLIDMNDGETDPRRAIRRLHRALRYGRHSIQAAKAYQYLGMYYLYFSLTWGTLDPLA